MDFFSVIQLKYFVIRMIKYVFRISGSVLLSWLMLNSCNNEDFELGGYLVSTRMTMGMLDTVSIKISNLMSADSVVTFNREVGYTGSHYDPFVGNIQTKTFIQFRLPRTEIAENGGNARFDSIVLVLKPNGSYYGDTTIHAAFRVYSLARQIETLDNGNLYSTSTVPIADMLADTSMRVRVKNLEDNEIEIKLPYSFGERLFQGLLRDEDGYQPNNFLRTFPGLAIGAGESSDCIHGFMLSDTTCMIRLYYNVTSTFREESIIELIANHENSFYSMTNDRIKLPFYNAKSDPVPTSETENMGIIMSGSPMYVRLEFPYLNDLLWLGQIVKIHRAILYVRPIFKSFDVVPLPPRLTLFPFDPTSNLPLGAAISVPSQGNAALGTQYGNLPEHYQNISSPEFPQYTFDITSFISQQLGRDGFAKWALSLGIPLENNEVLFASGVFSETTIQRLVIGDQNFWYKTENQSKDNRIKLEITYLVYND